MNERATIEPRPIDPAVSIYPLPMSAKRARHEARSARKHSRRLPIGHAYRWLPLWVPYGLACWLNRPVAE